MFKKTYIFFKYIPMLFILLISLIIFRVLFLEKKKTIEKFSEENSESTFSLVNEIRTLLMNNETQYQNNMNEVLDKISLLEENLNYRNMLQSYPTDPPVPTQQQIPVKPSVPTQQQIPVKPSVPTQQQIPVKPSVPTQQQIPIEPSVPTQQQIPIEPIIDEDSDDESNVSEDNNQTTEKFVDGISCSTTANCSTLF